MARLLLATPRLAAAVALAAAVVLALVAAGAAASSQAPGPALAPSPSPSAEDCSAAVTSLIGCASYVQSGSAQSKPPGDCCDGVRSAIMASPVAVRCLCDALGRTTAFRST